MDRTFLFMFGSALILAGSFGLIETTIRTAKARRRPRHFVERPRASEPFEAGPALAPTDEDLELIVVRERETNADGTERQEIIRDLQIGDPVTLALEIPDDEGGNDIRIDSGAGTIGYVPSSKVSQVLDLMSEGAEMHSEVSHIADADDRRGIWINISVWR